MTWTPYILLAGVLLLAAASFFFSLAESSLFALGRWRLKQLGEAEDVRGRFVFQLLQQPQDLLGALVLGNTFANAAIVALVFIDGFERDASTLLKLVGLFGFLLLGCEVIPKALAVRSPEPWALLVARPMQVIQRITRPFRRTAQRVNEFILRFGVPSSVKPLGGVTEEEYQELLELAFQTGTLGASEKEIILEILSLDRRTVKDVMRPRTQMACIADDLSLPEMLAAAREFKHRRLPMYDETPDTIVGVLNTRRLLLHPDADLAEVIEFPSFVPETMNLLQLLKSFQRQQRGLAVVLDEYGGTAGLVTLEDILEAMVGEIRSEVESEGFVVESLGPGRWRANGSLRIDDFRRAYPELGELEGVDTLGGLLVQQLGVVPEAGQSAVFRGLKLTALVVDDRRAREVLVEVVKGKAVSAHE